MKRHVLVALSGCWLAFAATPALSLEQGGNAGTSGETGGGADHEVGRRSDGSAPPPTTVDLAHAIAPFKTCGKLLTIAGEVVLAPNGEPKIRCVKIARTALTDDYTPPAPGPNDVVKVCGEVVDARRLYVVDRTGRRLERCGLGSQFEARLQQRRRFRPFPSSWGG